MGLFKEVLLLPLAPVRGTVWIADQLAREAERQARDPRLVQARLAALHRALDEGAIDEASFEEEEDRLLRLLENPVRRVGGRPTASVRTRTSEGLR
ncbi:gas vesicle protein GvpG [Streptomyces chilikensis]|uniref:Gas vesicle protein GvpG n=1 Tax=Streptomyces chilikensis TaxID=1194079 RepID=A0ABV3ETG8_9ACTN